MIIVTGAAGFIGSNVVKRLNSIGRKDLVLVDVLGKTQRWKNLRGLSFTDYYEADEFYPMVKSLDAQKIDAIIHMGACSDTTEENASYLLKNNTNISKLLVSFCYRSGVKIIYASSAATYGKSSDFDDDHSKLPYLRPLNMYGMSKHLVDMWILNQDWFRGRVVSLKFFNVFGPGEEHKEHMRSWICQSIMSKLENRSPILYDGTQDSKRDFIYIEDVIDVIMYALDNSLMHGVYNVGTGEARTFNAISTLIGKPEIVEMPTQLKLQYQDYTQANITKLRAAGFKDEFTPINEAIEDFTDYLSSSNEL